MSIANNIILENIIIYYMIKATIYLIRGKNEDMYNRYRLCGAYYRCMLS